MLFIRFYALIPGYYGRVLVLIRLVSSHFTLLISQQQIRPFSLTPSSLSISFSLNFSLSLSLYISPLSSLHGSQNYLIAGSIFHLHSAFPTLCFITPLGEVRLIEENAGEWKKGRILEEKQRNVGETYRIIRRPLKNRERRERECAES